MSLLINSFFVQGGIPKTGLTPTIRIWEVAAGSHSLVVGGPDPSMTEVGDGFYKYEFTAGSGYDDTKTYVVRSDGGAILAPWERYQVQSSTGENLSSLDITNIENGVWDATAVSHNTPGTTGALHNQTNANTTQLVIDVAAVTGLVDLILKYQTNRTRLDPVAKTLTIYDDDCTTPLRVFDVFDHLGTPSVDPACDRVPVSATDGEPVCP